MNTVNFTPSQLARDKYPANGPHQVVVNSDTRDVFISNEKDHTVSVFDGNGQVQVVKLPNLPSGTRLQMALSPSERSAVVLADTPQAGASESDCLFKITPGADGVNVQGPLFIEPGDYPKGSFSVDAQSGTTYIVNSRSGNMTRIPVEGGTAFDQVDVGLGRAQVAANPGDVGAFILHEARGQFWHVNADGPSPAVNVGGANDHYEMQVIPSQDQVALLNQSQNKVMRIRNQDGQVLVTEWNLPGGEHHMAVDQANGDIIVTNRDANSAMNFPNNDPNNPCNTLDIGGAPQAIVINPNNHFAFIQNGDASMTVIDNNGQVIPVRSDMIDIVDAPGVQAPTLEAGPRAMAVDDRQNVLYIPNEQTGTVSRFDDNGAVIVGLGKYTEPVYRPVVAPPPQQQPTYHAPTPAYTPPPQPQAPAEQPVIASGPSAAKVGATSTETLQNLPANADWRQGMAPKARWEGIAAAAQQLQSETAAVLAKPTTSAEEMQTKLWDDKMGTHKLSEDETAELKASVAGKVGPISRKKITDAFAAMEKALRDSAAHYPDPKPHVNELQTQYGADYKQAFKIRYFAGTPNDNTKLVQFSNDSVQVNGWYNLHASDKVGATTDEMIDLLHKARDGAFHSFDVDGPASKQTEGLWKKTSVADNINGLFDQINQRANNLHALAATVCDHGITVSSASRNEA